jgi:hypothetical protein
MVFFIVTLPVAPLQSLAHRFAKRKRAQRRACFDSGQHGCVCGTMTPLSAAIGKNILSAPMLAIGVDALRRRA